MHLEQQKYADLKHHYDSTISNMRQESKDRMEAKLYEERSEWRTKMDALNASSEQSKALIRSEVAQRYSEQIQQLTHQLTNMKEELDMVRNNNEDALIEQRESLLARLDPITKLYSSSSVEKGQSGEALIQNILSQIFTTCVIENVSQTDHCCDILFKLAELGIDALIEVKNKSSLRMEDVKKFHHDIMEQSEKINCALFISINTPNIPTKGNFAVDFRGGKPVIYMHMQSAEMIKHAVQMMGLLLKNINTDKTGGANEEKNNQHEVVELIGDIYSTIKSGSAKIHRIKITIAQLSRLANDTSVLISKSVDSIITFYTKFDAFKGDVDINEDANETKYSNEDVAKLVEYVKREQVIPTRSDISKMLTLSEVSIRKRGGVRELKKILKQHIVKKDDIPAEVLGNSDIDDSD